MEPQSRPRLRFDPTVNAGSLLTMFTIILAMGGWLTSYSADQARKEAVAAQLRIDVDQNRESLRLSLGRLESTTEEMRKSITQMQLDVAIMKAQQRPNIDLGGGRDH